MIRTQAVRDFATLADMRKEWSDLHRAARPGTPFEHPAWSQAWARHFVAADDLECVAVLDDAEPGSSELIGFAPMYRKRRLAGPVHIQPLGTGRGDPLTEVVQVLALPERHRDVLRAVSRHFEAVAGWSWLQLSLGPQQGWLVPQWLDDRATTSIIHRAVRPSVVMDPLPADQESLWRGLKHNVRESVRRSRNRARRAGDVSLTCVDSELEIPDALGRLVDLHRRRAQLVGKVRHVDQVAGHGRQAFVTDAVRGLAAEGLARVHLAERDGQAVAALLVLSDGSTDYMSISGMDTDHWHLGANTLLIFEALARAVRLGRTAFNFSTGPDVAKLRWSSQIATFNDFAIVRGDWRSQWFYGLHAHARLALEHRLERSRHGIAGTPPTATSGRRT